MSEDQTGYELTTEERDDLIKKFTILGEKAKNLLNDQIKIIDRCNEVIKGFCETESPSTAQE